MADETTDIQVRTAKFMAAVIKAAVPKANVYHYWILGQGPIGESWPDMLSEDEDDWEELNNAYRPWAHAYVIGFEEEPCQRTTNYRRKDTTTFRLWGFYGFMKGTVDKNSHDIALVHWHEIKNALSAALCFQSAANPSGVSEVSKHNEWQITQAGVYWMGDNKCHIAQGTIEVESSVVVPQVAIG